MLRQFFSTSTRRSIQAAWGMQASAPDSISGALQRYRSMLASDRSNRVDFNRLQMVRSELSDDVERASRAGENNKARLLGGVLRETGHGA